MTTHAEQVPAPDAVVMPRTVTTRVSEGFIRTLEDLDSSADVVEALRRDARRSERA